MYPYRPDAIVRIAEPGGEERRSEPCQPRPPSVVEGARQLVEGRRLTLTAIGHGVGASQGTISRWASNTLGSARPAPGRASDGTGTRPCRAAP